MSFNLKVGGTWETLASGWVKVSGSWEEIQSAFIKVAGTWEQVYQRSLGLSITDSTPSGSNSGANPTGPVSSNTTTVSVVSGGSGSYTYAWTLISAPSTNGPFSPGSPTSATTGFSDTDVAATPAQVETWRCTVTDTGNGRTGSISATVTLNWTDTT